MAPKRLALASAVALLAATARADGPAGSCPVPIAQMRDSVLLQAHQALAPTKGVSALEMKRSFGVTSDCASRLSMWDERSSACLLVQDGKALLVDVPYGSHPGWDFPGGTKHSGEAACETAEREVCEETGYQVRALEQLSWNVFRCEIVAEGVCTKPVDEGFLEKRWWSKGDLDHLTFRAYTWGDKESLMRQHLPESSSVPDSSEPDFVGVCGCHVCQNEGFSTTSDQCTWGKDTSPEEACACLQASSQQGPELLDDCGCKACEGEGWSAHAGACAQGSSTEPHEACECRKQAAP
mmetsp:Transcript_17534/g.46712  ORF Transcript_17534/g.46712 Transcript_17534/m.46712 type:complete len:295 (-) Transcript_17534:574-1458(-)